MRKFNLLLLASFMVLFFVSCETDEPVDTSQLTTDINELVRSAGALDNSVAAHSPRRVGSVQNTVETENGKKWNLKTTKYSLAKNLEDLTSFKGNINTNTMWAGALVQGRELHNGILNSLGDNIPRKPITITVESGGNRIGAGSMVIENPTHATSSEALQTILEGVNGTTTAQMVFNRTIAHEIEQACLDVGVSSKWLGANGNFETETKSNKKDIFIYFKQIYYTITANDPTNPTDYIGSDVDMEVLRYKVTADNPLCYVSSVSYGRLLMAKISYTGTKTAKEAKAEIEGAFKFLVDGTGDYQQSTVIEKSEFSGFILGGSANGATKALTNGLNGIVDFINEGANYSANSPGYPISYTVKNLADNSIVKLGETTEYEVKEYELSDENEQLFEVYLYGFQIYEDCDGMGGSGDFYYSIDVQDKYGQSLIGGATANPNEINVDDGGEILLDKYTQTFALPKESGQTINVVGYLYDEDASSDQYMDEFDLTFSFPWDDDRLSNYDGGYYRLHMDAGNSCSGALYFKINKK